MIDLYYFPTPNGLKITLFLEETGLAHRIVPVDIRNGGQFDPAFLAVSPNNRIPAIVDHAPADGGAALPVFESGAILQYLADKTGQFLSPDLRVRTETLQWLFWQMAGLGPMAGQSGHFRRAAPEQIPYAIKRYADETARLYAVLDRRLADRPFLAGEAYSIADMACFPWIEAHEGLGQPLDELPHLAAWLERIRARPATVRALEAAVRMRAQVTAP